MGKKRKGKGSSKNKLSGKVDDDQYVDAPHSIVINRGHVGKNVNNLILDMRRVMEPFTASKIKARKKNVLKDYVSIAGMLNVTHLITFSKTEFTTNMRVVRLPRGPTLTFRVSSYALCRDVISSLKRHNMEPKQFKHHPLLVLNNFTGEGMHFKLISSMFQNLFPSININKVKLGDIRRVVLLNYEKDTDTIEFRHFNIRAVPVGMSRAVKKIVRAKIPDLSRFEDVSEYVLKGGNLSESEAEMDGPENEVILPQSLAGRGNVKASQSAIRLTEIGPRLTIQLVKIEAGVCTGEVLYHKYIEKTPEEIEDIQAARDAKKKEKAQRKADQANKVQIKEQKKMEHKEKSLKGIKKKQLEEVDEADSVSIYVEDKADVEYFKEEVGAEPDDGLFSTTSQRPMKRKAPNENSLHKDKKRKVNKNIKVVDKKGIGERDKSKRNNAKNQMDKFEAMDWAAQRDRETKKKSFRKSRPHQAANVMKGKTLKKKKQSKKMRK